MLVNDQQKPLASGNDNNGYLGMSIMFNICQGANQPKPALTRNKNSRVKPIIHQPLNPKKCPKMTSLVAKVSLAINLWKTTPWKFYHFWEVKHQAIVDVNDFYLSTIIQPLITTVTKLIKFINH